MAQLTLIRAQWRLMYFFTYLSRVTVLFDHDILNSVHTFPVHLVQDFFKGLHEYKLNQMQVSIFVFLLNIASLYPKITGRRCMVFGHYCVVRVRILTLKKLSRLDRMRCIYFRMCVFISLVLFAHALLKLTYNTIKKNKHS